MQPEMIRLFLSGSPVRMLMYCFNNFVQRIPLIELLIVWYFGDTGSIAIPIFCRQIRANIARSYSDMKSLDSSVRMLYMDSNHLPVILDL